MQQPSEDIAEGAGVEPDFATYRSEDVAELLQKVGDESDRVAANLQILAPVLALDVPAHHDEIARLVLDSVCGLPQNTATYACLVGLLRTAGHSEFVDELLNLMARRLVSLLARPAATPQALLSLKLLVRFYAELGNAGVLAAADVAGVVCLLVRMAQERACTRVRADALFYVALAAVVYAGAGLADGGPAGEAALEEIMQDLKEAMKGRDTWVNPLIEGSKSNEQTIDAVTQLWNMVQTAGSTGQWRCRGILRPWEELGDALGDRLHPMFAPPFPEEAAEELDVVPPSGARDYVGGVRIPHPYVTSESADASPLEEQLTWWAVGELVSDALVIHYKAPREAVKFLAAQPRPEERGGMSFPRVVVQTVLRGLLQLPIPWFRHVYYHTVLVEMCKPETIEEVPAIVAAEVDRLYAQVEALDIELADRLAEWFAIHLSNFGFTWNWNAWAGAARLPRDAPRRVFVRSLLARCMWLSYHERIAAVLPRPLDTLLPRPPRPEVDAPLHEPVRLKPFHRAIFDAVRGALPARPGHDAVLDALAEEADEDVRTRLLLESVFWVACKSFTHAHLVLKRCAAALRQLPRGTRAAPAPILLAVGRVLRYHEQLQAVEKQLKQRAAAVQSAGEAAPAGVEKAHISEPGLRDGSEGDGASDNESEEEDDDDYGRRRRRRPPSSPRRQAADGVEKETRELLVAVYAQFAGLLAEHFAKCKREGTSPYGTWYMHVVGHFAEVGRKYNAETAPLFGMLEGMLFSSSADERISGIFENIRMLYKDTISSTRR